MTLTPYQIVAPLVSIVAISYAWSLVFRRKKTLWEAVLWTLFWGMVAWFALQPDIVGYLAVVTGIQDRGNAVVITFLGILFLLVFTLVIRIEELEQRQTRLVRRMALKDAGMEGKKEMEN